MDALIVRMYVLSESYKMIRPVDSFFEYLIVARTVYILKECDSA
jgi:hypothetical protein